MGKNEPPSYGLHRLSITSNDDLVAAKSLARRIGQIELIETAWQRVANISVKPPSQMGRDDQHSGWRQLSHTVNHALNAAVDDLRGFRELVHPEAAESLTLPYAAHFPILRAALESSSLALWLVSPDDPRLRIERHLRACAAELADEAAMQKQVIRAARSDGRISKSQIGKGERQQADYYEHHASRIRTIARELGLPDFTGRRGVVGYAEIVREATAATGLLGDYGETMWRMLSGLTHPSVLRAVAHSQLDEIVDNGDGTLHGVMTTDIGLTQTALEASWINANAAIAFFGRRKVTPGDPANYVAGTSP